MRGGARKNAPGDRALDGAPIVVKFLARLDL